MATTKIQSGAFPADVITSSAIDDLSVTHAKLHTTMDLSSKTVTLPTLNQSLTLDGPDAGVAKLRLQAEEVHGDIEGINIGNNFGGLAFKTNNNGTVAERVRIDNAGNVGIGTSSPDADLSLLSPVYTSGGTGNGVRFQNQNNNADAIIQSYYSGTSASALFSGANAYLSTGAAFTSFDSAKPSSYVLQNTNGNIEIGNAASGNPTTKMLLNTSGKVGIGIDDPLAPLHVFSGEIGNGSNKGIRISNNGGSQHYSIRTGLTGINNHTLSFHDDTAGTDRIVISNGGNVGIGTIDPARTLHVKDASEANIRIQGGSDYAELRVKDSEDKFSMHYGGSQVISLDSNEIFFHKNTSAIGTQGAYFNSNYSHVTTTNDSPLTLNRLGNNNNLNYALDVRKDSTNAGGISVQDTWNSTKTSSFHPMSSHTYGYGLHGLNLHGYDVGRLDQSNDFDGGSQSGAYMPGIIGTSPKNMKYLVLHFQVVGDNVYRPFMINMNDVKGVLEIVGGDASSRGYKRWYVNYTSTAYGVYGITEAESVGGGWNSGSFSARLEAPNGALAVGFKFSSYYSSTNVASFKAIWRAI